ncbi:hypothetical protein DD630_03280 [Streptomyces sp. BSE7F]|nr:hypothetical protein DD630_03280 [Streptomyces sp. BSE7F]
MLVVLPGVVTPGAVFAFVPSVGGETAAPQDRTPGHRRAQAEPAVSKSRVRSLLPRRRSSIALCGGEVGRTECAGDRRTGLSAGAGRRHAGPR